MTTPLAIGRRLFFPGGKQVETENFPVPGASAGEVLVATTRSLLSTGTETIVYSRKFDPGTHWDAWVKYPFLPGYAAVGEVLDIGEGVTSLRAGDRVALRYNHASHALVAGSDCYRVPEDVSDDDAVWFPLAKIAGHGVRAAGIELGDNVVVIGAGPVGQMATRWALACGAGKVLTLDLSEPRLQMAAACGAIPVCAPADQALAAIQDHLHGERPRIVIDSTGNAAVLRAALTLPANHGTVVLLGDTGSPGSQTLSADVITRGLTLVGAHDGHNPPQWNNPVAAGHFFTFVQGGRLSLQGLNTHLFRPEQCKEAYTLAAEDRLRTMGILFDWSAT